MPLLELKNVVTAYGRVEALKGLTMCVEQGEIVALLGSNGAGKSTTLRTIFRIDSAPVWYAALL